MLIHQKLQEITGVEIEWETLPLANLREALTPRLAAGADLPDIINMYGIANPQILQYANDGLLLDITDLVAEHAPGLSEYYRTNKVAYSLGTFAGKIYSFPSSISFKNEYSVGLLLNTAWLEELGLAQPSTLDELYDVLLKFKALGNDKVPLTAMSGLEKYLRNAFGDMWNHTTGSISYLLDNDKVYAFETTDGYKQYLIFLNRLFEEGLLDQEFTSITPDGITAKAANNQLGGLITYDGYGSLLTNDAIDPSKETATFVPIKPLRGPFGYDPYNIEVKPITGHFVISKSADNPEMAVKFLDTIMFNQAALDLLYYGIEGMTYEVRDGKKVVIDSERLLAEGGNETTLPTVQLVEPVDAMMPAAFVEAEKSNMRPYHIQGYPHPNLTLEEAEKISSFPDAITYLNEESLKFITGVRNINEFEQFAERLNNLGLAEMVSIQQVAYDRFLHN